ncbi:MAG: shikimate dehydrogenase [Victivallales bacterium]|nr:shikimate dehydrogenase [Victivallales bacterium]
MFEPDAQIKYVVIGDPIIHSLSPQMQNAGFAAAGLGNCYGKMRVAAADFAEFIDFARKNLSGFNITVPHKNRIIPYLDSIADEAALAGSVNTVIVKSGRLYGCSTDGCGLENALRETFGFALAGSRVLFIGCGGAVQALAFHFAAAGADELYFVNRTPAKAAALGQKISADYPACKCAFCGLDDDAGIKGFINSSTLMVQGTSLGLKSGDPLPVKPELLTGADLCFYDTIYQETPMLQAARAAGLRAADGRTMLLHQGVKSFELWTGLRAPVEEMRRALYQAMALKKEETLNDV